MVIVSPQDGLFPFQMTFSWLLNGNYYGKFIRFYIQTIKAGHLGRETTRSLGDFSTTYGRPGDDPPSISWGIPVASLSPRRGLDSTAVGDEGGFAPAVADPEEVGIDAGKKIVGLKKGSATWMS